MKISDLVKETHDRAIRKGWYDKPRSWEQHLLLIHSEASEACEAMRRDEPVLWYTDSGKPEGLASELADIIIRCCDAAADLGIDLEDAIRKKSDYNETRPYRHGGKKL